MGTAEGRPCRRSARTLCVCAACHAEVAAKKAELAARKEERRKAQAELQARKRMLGNIVFVGQLFK